MWCLQDQSENAHDGDLYDDVITSRDDAVDEVCYCDECATLHRYHFIHWIYNVALAV